MTAAGIPRHSPLSMASPDHSDSKGVNASHAGKKKATASVHSNGEDAAPAAREGMTRLPKLEVDKILSRDPRTVAPYSVEAIRELASEERPDAPEEVLSMVAESFNEEAREEFGAFRSWVLAEVEEKGYVEVPDEFVEETEAVRKRRGEHVDLYLPDRHFSTVVGEDGSEKLVFCFKKKEKVVTESELKQGNNFVSFSVQLEQEIKAAFRKMLPESGQDEEESDEDEDEEDGDSDKDN